MITDTQKKERRRFIGSSDIAALFTGPDGKSLDPFKTAADVWATKVFDFDESTASPSIKTGIRWEPYIIGWAAEQLGVKVETDPDKLRFICRDHPIFASNLDGYAVGEKNKYEGQIAHEHKMAIIEAKKTRLAGEWGEPGTDQIPFRVILQVHTQMLCTGWDHAYVAAMIQGEETLYELHRDERIIEAIIRRGEDFWNNNVLTKTPPLDCEPADLDILKRVRRIPEKYADIDTELVTTWDTARANRLEAEKREDAAFATLLTYIGDAEGVRLPDGREFTYFKQSGRDKIDMKRLKAEHPDIYAAISTPSEHRVARIRSAKSAK